MRAPNRAKKFFYIGESAKFAAQTPAAHKESPVPQAVQFMALASEHELQVRKPISYNLSAIIFICLLQSPARQRDFVFLGGHHGVIPCANRRRSPKRQRVALGPIFTGFGKSGSSLARRQAVDLDIASRSVNAPTWTSAASGNDAYLDGSVFIGTSLVEMQPIAQRLDASEKYAR